MCPVQFVTHVSGRSKDWLAVEAVRYELFSGPNSLLTGKNTGNFRTSAKTIRR